MEMMAHDQSSGKRPYHLCQLQFTAVSAVPWSNYLTTLRTVGLPKLPIIFWNGLRKTEEKEHSSVIEIWPIFRCSNAHL